jgi:hypothetical protein
VSTFYVPPEDSRVIGRLVTLFILDTVEEILYRLVDSLLCGRLLRRSGRSLPWCRGTTRCRFRAFRPRCEEMPVSGWSNGGEGYLPAAGGGEELPPGATGISAAPMFCLYSRRFRSKSGLFRYSSRALTRDTGACEHGEAVVNDAEGHQTDCLTYMFKVRHGHVDNVIQPPSCVEVFYDPVVLFAEGLVNPQRFLGIRLGHFKVVLCGGSVLAEFTKTPDERTKQIDDSFVDSLNQH